MWTALKKFFTSFFNKINKLYKETPPDAPEGKYIADLHKSAKKIRDAFLEGAVEAGKKANAKTTKKTTAKEVKSKARITSEQDAAYLDAVTYDDNGNVISLSERFNEKSKDIRYKARNVEKYTEKEYNSFGWVRANEVLSADEYYNFTTEFSKAKTSKEYDAYKSDLDEYMISVGAMHGDKEGVKNRIVFAKGTIANPEITRIIEIDADNETFLSDEREYIYALEKRGIRTKADETIKVYTSVDARSASFGERSGNQNASDNLQLGADRGTGSGTAQKVKEILFDDEGNEVSRTIRHKSRSSVTSGQYEQMKANLSHSKVYSKKSAMELVSKIAPGIRNRSFEALSNQLWEGLNAYTTVDDRIAFANDMKQKYITTKITQPQGKGDFLFISSNYKLDRTYDVGSHISSLLSKSSLFCSSLCLCSSLFSCESLFLCCLLSCIGDCADRKSKLSVLIVDFGDLNVNYLTYLKNVSRIVDSLAGNSGDVDETVYVLINHSECAEWHDGNDLSGNDVTNVELLSELEPGIHLLSLVAERNSLLLNVKLLDEYVNLLTNAYNLRRMLNSLPRELRVVNHTVNAADINERTVRSKVLNGTHEVLTNLELSPSSLFTSLLFFYEKHLDRTKSLLLFGIKLKELNSLSSTNESGEIAALSYTGLRCRYEYGVAASGEDYTTLNYGNNLALENFAVIESVLENNPAVVSVYSFLGHGSDALAILNSDNEYFDFVTNLEHILEYSRRIISNLILGKDAGELSAKVELYLALTDGEHGTNNCISCM